MGTEKTSMLGDYGEWASRLVADPPLLSFRRDERSIGAVEEWRHEAVGKTLELLAVPSPVAAPKVKVHDSYDLDGLAVDELEWALPYGPPTRGIFLRPLRRSGLLPGVLGLHDHGMVKYFGWEKIAEGRQGIHPLLAEKRELYYGGRSWANELARDGFAVLVHDVFPFGSRRISEHEVSPEIRRSPTGVPPQRIEEILEYDRWASDHESIVAKSLFSAGTTWPGVYLLEDRVALDYLISREEVDASRVGCCGLSGGGMRTAYLAGLDHRVRAAVCAGFMTTWRDFLLNVSHAHTWMAYTPGLPQFLDFPELAALRVPLPLFVQNNSEDDLFSLDEMRRAERILAEVYRKAGEPDALRVEFYPGPHKFDLRMQKDAFAWLSRSLGA